MRSLAASNPFLSARESLMQLFDDAARKVPSSSFICYFYLEFAVIWKWSLSFFSLYS